MCSGAALLYKVPKIVIGENKTFRGPEEYLHSCGVELVVLDVPECIRLMKDFIAAQPQLWNEDIGMPATFGPGAGDHRNALAIMRNNDPRGGNKHPSFDKDRFISRLLTPIPAPAQQAPSLPYKAYTVKSADGVALAVQEWGNPSGPEIVFIHGVFQSNLSWSRQVKSDLAKAFRMVTFDLRGHGNSDKPLRVEAYREGRRWADDIDAVIKQVGLDEPPGISGSCVGCWNVRADSGMPELFPFVRPRLLTSHDLCGRGRPRYPTASTETAPLRRSGGRAIL